MKILYLYSELMGYQIPVLKEYVKNYRAEVHVIHWDHRKLTPYAPPVLNGVFYYPRSKFDFQRLLKFASDLQPDLVYVSGWMDRAYLSVSRILKKRGIPIVAGCDTQWRGDLRQTVGSIYFRMFIRRSISKLWVAGPYQYEYARRLGFRKDEIIFNCLSGDSSLFQRVSPVDIVPKKFVFVGRLIPSKGVEILLAAWDNIQDKKGWSLTFIGNGDLRSKLRKADVEVIDFVQPEILSSLLKNFGVLLLPSLREPWALVIQEAMMSGLPVVATDICGAAPVFITENYTGFTIPPNDILTLSRIIEKIVNMDNQQLGTLSKNAFGASMRITPELVAASFMSAVGTYDKYAKHGYNDKL